MSRETSYLPFEHAFHILELDSVLELIAGPCINEGAREILRRSTPTTDVQWIADALKEIKNMRTFLTLDGDIPIASTDTQAAIERARKTSELISGKDLLAIARVESTALDIRRRFRNKETIYPHLCRLIDRFVPDKTLVDVIMRALNSDGDIKDDATDALASIRKRIRSSREGLRGHAERQSKQYGDNAYPTLLEGRFTILVPRDRFRRRDGIVHSKSHSGGSMYFEPLSLVEMNNEFETLLQDEKAEVARILQSLTQAVVSGIDDLRRDFETMNRLDALRAKARFSETYNCMTPALSHTRGMRLVKARHPLLELSLEQDPGSREVVPLDIEIAGNEPVLVITGPNAGGKTVAIKTLGVVVLMHQLGLQVPAAVGTELRIFENVFTDIGDEQSISSSLSTFTSHLRHLDAMCRLTTEESLCLIDEIGDGTDPDEGAALANATLEKLLAKRSVTVATTHYGKVKTFALRTAGVSNASMVFDDATQEPLYRLLQGVAGRSRGIDTAERCGFDEEVIRRAKILVGEKAFQLESILAELEASHLAIEKERTKLQSQSENLKRLIETYEERAQELRQSRAELDEKAKREAEAIVVQARRDIERIVKEIRESGARKEIIREGHKRLRELLEQTRAAPRPQKGVALEVGDHVSLSEEGEPRGRVVDVEKETATVEMGGKKIKIKMWELYKLSPDAVEPTAGVSYDISVDPLVSTVIDVRGQTREEALEAVDRFLDRAALSGVHVIQVIHGMGEGVLLNAVHQHIQNDPRVKSFRLGFPGEGGSGITMIELA